MNARVTKPTAFRSVCARNAVDGHDAETRQPIRGRFSFEHDFLFQKRIGQFVNLPGAAQREKMFVADTPGTGGGGCAADVVFDDHAHASFWPSLQSENALNGYGIGDVI